MDITGARWGPEGAEAILRLRAIIANGDFEEYWRFDLRREHERIHHAKYCDGLVLAANYLTSKEPHPKKYPDELRERAVKMLFEVREREGKGHGELARVARQLGVHPEALRSWAKQAEIDGGVRPGTTTDDKQRIAELEKENRELRRANEILKAASAYFARELDPRLPR